MRIAIDARPLASPLTGIGRYTDSLVRRLVQSEDHDWFLYSDRPLTAETPRGSNVTIRTGDARGGSPGSLRWAQWEYVKWAKQDQIDTFWSPRHHLPLLLPDSVRTVVTIHDLVWKRYPETMQRKNYWLERFLMGPSIQKADQVICVSGFTAKEVNHFYPKAIDKCTVVYEAADLPPLSTESLPDEVKEPYLLFVGTLEPRKNLARLLKAYASLNKHEAPSLVLVGGQGWGDLVLEKTVNDLDLTTRVQLLGYVSDDELQTLYSKASCLLMPSLYEGFGLPALEAMQHGVPVIYSKGTSLEEVVGPGGISVNPGSADEIASAILSLTSADSSALSNNARNQAARFSWDTAIQQTLELLIAC